MEENEGGPVGDKPTIIYPWGNLVWMQFNIKGADPAGVGSRGEGKMSHVGTRINK